MVALSKDGKFMFYYIKGKLVAAAPGYAVIDAMGVAYKLTVSENTYRSLPARHTAPTPPDALLYTYLAVREDGIELFGFGSEAERSAFNNLTSVSGVGPKVAMSILSVMTPDDLAIAISTENIKAIAKAPGIGAKSAARIVLELKDKIAKDFVLPDAKTLTAGASAPKTKQGKNFSEATEALTVLGYDKNSIIKALADVDPTKDVGEMIRIALKKLS